MLKSKLQESIIGFPKYFEVDSAIGSTSFTENIVSTFDLINAIETHLRNKEKINVLEIGAGWGAVLDQLIQFYGDRINKVAICDLHENLFISSFYLQAVNPGRKAYFVSEKEATSSSDHSLTFCSPGRINNLDIEFDLVINMISFQEMSMAVIEDYMRYIKSHLSEGGIFYSENGVVKKNPHQRAEKFSDYFYAKYFHILDIKNGNRFCPHLFNGNKHVAILTHKHNSTPELNSKHLDALSLIMNLRLDKNIETLKVNTISGKNTPDEIRTLELIERFFSTSDTKIKAASLKELATLKDDFLYRFIRAMGLISNKKFEQALEQLYAMEKELFGLVRVNVLCYIGLMDKPAQYKMLELIGQIRPEMLNTAKSIFKYHSKSRINMTENIRWQLNLKVKKYFGKSPRQWSVFGYLVTERLIEKLKKWLEKVSAKSEIPYHLR